VTAAGRLTAIIVAVVGCFTVPIVRAQSRVVIEEVRVHGNYATPDAEVVRLAAIELGVPADASVFDAITRRLEDSGQFSRVELRRRSRSLVDDGKVALVIVVTEHPSVQPVDLGLPKVPGPLGRLRSQTMFLPILSVEDGYGLTYGLRTAIVGGRASATRVSVPASWGGTRQLAVEAERSFMRAAAPAAGAGDLGLLNRGVVRIKGRAGVWRQEHPFFERGQLRKHLDAEVSYRPRPLVAIGATAGTAAVSFGDVDDRMTTGGVFAEFDTRRDPLFPRNAVLARTSWSRLSFARPEQSGVPDGARSRWQHDLRGYVGVIGQVVLAARLQLDQASGPLPDYARPILGGADTLRGLRAGFGVGDNLWASSLEARVPLSSVLRSSRLGVLAFYDTGATWNYGQRLRDGHREEGVGAGVFLVNPFVQLQLSVARGLGRSTRVHFSTGVSF
jgi:outer membrane protein assembly factor BamA